MAKTPSKKKKADDIANAPVGEPLSAPVVALLSRAQDALGEAIDLRRLEALHALLKLMLERGEIPAHRVEQLTSLLN